MEGLQKINPVKNRDGFTLIELVTVILIVSILLSIGYLYMGDLRNRASDSHAYNEGRHLLTALNDTFLAGEDVYLGDGSTVSGVVGATTIGGVARTPIFSLSKDVRARLDGLNGPGSGDGFATVFIWNINGTPDTTPSSRKEYLYIIDEAAGLLSAPTF